MLSYGELSRTIMRIIRECELAKVKLSSYNFAMWIILIVAPPSKIGPSTGATIRGNTVYQNSAVTVTKPPVFIVHDF